MKVIARSTLEAFWLLHPDAEQPLKSWFDEVSKAKWATPQELKAQFRNASVRPGRRVIFNIKGNDYRLVTAVAYRFQAVYIKFIGTHEQYDAIDVDTVG
ncbi:type II toxin-antitoxin system HigB family toxin [Roseateles amylovorans]|uniref:Type II toxin-antitoxin system HigB family toxin n=1 Tax=Roseateles amylovorans TaxID=2978473 RepID=A0ABY6AXJ5_9BURK|nr:type II toxin-antitoxin system HigB family toxin [Roseateles amylovorans]UXH77515.1 type II toxin-antitoxin system HigB family toxin [Roseateles amylovorans]